MKKLLAICGSASPDSANLALLRALQALLPPPYALHILDALQELPHFVPALPDHQTPAAVVAFRRAVEQAEGVIICTPEYIFSLPARLKNALEWCVSTTVFTAKPVALLTASASGRRGHQELQLLLKTLGALFTESTTLLIQGVKGKVKPPEGLPDKATQAQLHQLLSAFLVLVEAPSAPL